MSKVPPALVMNLARPPLALVWKKVVAPLLVVMTAWSAVLLSRNSIVPLLTIVASAAVLLFLKPREPLLLMVIAAWSALLVSRKFINPFDVMVAVPAVLELKKPIVPLLVKTALAAVLLFMKNIDAP